ncbi:unnamed protein product, partial [Trichobilharzia regenti]
TGYLSVTNNRLLEKRVKDFALQSIGGSHLENSSIEMHRRLYTLSVSSRMFSPTVEMFHQLTLTSASHLLNCSWEEVSGELVKRSSGTTWAHVGAVAVFSIDELKEAIKNARNADSQPAETNEI